MNVVAMKKSNFFLESNIHKNLPLCRANKLKMLEKEKRRKQNIMAEYNLTNGIVSIV
jgi:hypothetical protein